MAKQRAIPEQIRQAIRESGRSLNQLAQACGIDSGRLSRFMRGERDLTLDGASQLCEVLGIRLTDPSGTEKPAPKATPATPPAAELEATEKQPRGKRAKER